MFCSAITSLSTNEEGWGFLCQSHRRQSHQLATWVILAKWGSHIDQDNIMTFCRQSRLATQWFHWRHMSQVSVSHVSHIKINTTDQSQGQSQPAWKHIINWMTSQCYITNQMGPSPRSASKLDNHPLEPLTWKVFKVKSVPIWDSVFKAYYYF